MGGGQTDSVSVPPSIRATHRWTEREQKRVWQNITASSEDQFTFPKPTGIPDIGDNEYYGSPLSYASGPGLSGSIFDLRYISDISNIKRGIITIYDYLDDNNVGGDITELITIREEINLIMLGLYNSTVGAIDTPAGLSPEYQAYKDSNHYWINTALSPMFSSISSGALVQNLNSEILKGPAYPMVDSISRASGVLYALVSDGSTVMLKYLILNRELDSAYISGDITGDYYSSDIHNINENLLLDVSIMLSDIHWKWDTLHLLLYTSLLEKATEADTQYALSSVEMAIDLELRNLLTLDHWHKAMASLSGATAAGTTGSRNVAASAITGLASGAMSGAAMGWAIGSAGGPIGMPIGAAIGGLIGLVGGLFQ